MEIVHLTQELKYNPFPRYKQGKGRNYLTDIKFSLLVV